MIKWSILVVTFLAISTAATVTCQAQDNARRFITALEAYKAQKFDTAVSEFEQIARSGVRNGELYYNLGNAHLKNNNLGQAILWYERALKLLPNDPDLRFNADYARSLTRDAAEDDSTSLVRIFFFWKYKLSNRAIIILSLTLNTLFWCLMLAKRLGGIRSLRYAAMAIALPALILILTAGFNYYENTHQKIGIVLKDRVEVRSGLNDTSTELFVLHAGARVKVVKNKEEHLQIRFSSDKIGWIHKSAMGYI